ncbi:hypothetical protein D7147_23020 [Micromonospora musae]|uniref:RCK N-terminal domain-containing protein n=2 Tax=Micromonospora musae TaxID=1894970 RepID=A0ABX9R1A7_9ACTN|nr:hypothetical protein D7147_23020 [Micromonospora musae]
MFWICSDLSRDLNVMCMVEERRSLRYVVCGDDRLAVELVRNLARRPDAVVAVVLPPDVAARFKVGDIPNVHLVTAEPLDRETLHLAKVAEAETVALLSSTSALRQALLVRELNPAARLVVRSEVGEAGEYPMLPGCTFVFSSSAAAVAHVAALADAAPTVKARVRRLRTQRRLLRQVLQVRVARIAATSLVVTALGTGFLMLVNQVGVFDALYSFLMNGQGGPDPLSTRDAQVFDVVYTLLTVTGGVVTGIYLGDAVQHARALAAAGVLPKGSSGHVVVVGLGGLGSQVVGALRRAGAEIVAVDVSEAARGVHVARDLAIPVIVDDASRSETLSRAAVERCRALLLLTPDDDASLATALAARAIRPDLPIIWRPRNDETAALVAEQLGVIVPRASEDDFARQLAELVTVKNSDATHPRTTDMQAARRSRLPGSQGGHVSLPRIAALVSRLRQAVGSASLPGNAQQGRAEPSMTHEK